MVESLFPGISTESSLHGVWINHEKVWKDASCLAIREKVFIGDAAVDRISRKVPTYLGMMRSDLLHGRINAEIRADNNQSD